jgi:hypothetical protein
MKAETIWASEARQLGDEYSKKSEFFDLVNNIYERWLKNEASSTEFLELAKVWYRKLTKKELKINSDLWWRFRRYVTCHHLDPFGGMVPGKTREHIEKISESNGNGVPKNRLAPLVVDDEPKKHRLRFLRPVTEPYAKAAIESIVDNLLMTARFVEDPIKRLACMFGHIDGNGFDDESALAELAELIRNDCRKLEAIIGVNTEEGGER